MSRTWQTTQNQSVEAALNPRFSPARLRRTGQPFSPRLREVPALAGTRLVHRTAVPVQEHARAILASRKRQLPPVRRQPHETIHALRRRQSQRFGQCVDLVLPDKDMAVPPATGRAAQTGEGRRIGNRLRRGRHGIIAPRLGSRPVRSEADRSHRAARRRHRCSRSTPAPAPF